MKLSMWIREDLQFCSTIELKEAQKTKIERKVVYHIRSQLFDLDSGSFVERLLAFSKQLDEYQPDEKKEKIWNRLILPNEKSSTVSLEKNVQLPEQVNDQVTAIFCFVIQSLCEEIARSSIKETEEELRNAEGELEDKEDTSDEEEDTFFPGSRAEYYKVVSAITKILRNSYGTEKGEEDQQAVGESLRLFAGVLLDSLLFVLDTWFEVKTEKTTKKDGKPHTNKYILIRETEMGQHLKNFIKKLPFLFTVQPLKQPVEYTLKTSAPKKKDFHFTIDLIQYRRSNSFLRELHAEILKDSHRPPSFERYLEAINHQQQVAWQINRRLLKTAEQLNQIHDAGPSYELLRDWVTKNFCRPPSKRKTVELPGEFIKSPLARCALKELSQDGQDGLPIRFYLPWKADYRGRIYPVTPWLSPQGGDLQRALLEFAEGAPLNEEGVSALRRHGANLVDKKFVIEELGSTNQVLTLQEREDWVLRNEEHILASAESPLTKPFWRVVAKKPMQFLAFCFAYQQWKLEPTKPIHLPAQIDGTCNGLQHIAALTGDRELAKSVNVLANETVLPRDIYEEVSNVARNLRNSEIEIKEDEHTEGLKSAEIWLQASQDRLNHFLSRKSAKKAIMTIPYGAGQEAQAAGVLESIEEIFEEEFEKDSPNSSELDWFLGWKLEEDKRRYLVGACSKDRFKTLRKKMFDEKKNQDVAYESTKKVWEQKRTFAAYVALAIVRRLRAVISKRYPSVDFFSEYLKEKAKSCKGLPLFWLTPLGFLVCQDGFKIDKKSTLNVTLGRGDRKRKVSLSVQRLSDKTSDSEQQKKLLPNLIHSLDATHLAMTLLEAKNRGISNIGSVHDCLMCHPNDIENLSETVRKTFVDLYSKNGQTPLIAWNEWMDLIARLNTEPMREAEIHWMFDAIDKPGERSEYDFLEQENTREQRQALLKELRSLDPLQKFLVGKLQEVLSNREPKEKKREKNRKLEGESEESSYIARCLFGGSENTAMSPYFFS